MVNPEINLNQLVDGGSNQKYALSINNETADAELKRKMTYYLFFFALLIVGIVFAGCVYTFSTGAIRETTTLQ